MSRPRESQRRPAVYPDRRKTCPKCGIEKPWSSFYPLERHPDDTVARVRSSCKTCESERARRVWQENLEMMPAERETFNAERRRYHNERIANEPEFAEHRRVYVREYHRWRYEHDPEFREEVKRIAREYRRTPRGRMLNRRWKQRNRREMNGPGSRQHRLDPKPWQEWIVSLLDTWTLRELEVRLGVDEATIRRWRDGKEGVSLERADECLNRWGDPFLLHVIWDVDSLSQPSGDPVILHV